MPLRIQSRNMYELTCDRPFYLILVLTLEPRVYRRRDNYRRKSVNQPSPLL